MTHTRITEDGHTLEVTQNVFNDHFAKGGEWRTETRAYRRLLCRAHGCRNAMSFPEWEQHFWRCPMCGEQN